MGTEFILSTIRSALQDAASYLGTIEDGAKIVKEGGAFGDLKNDTEIKADKLLGEFFLNALQPIPGLSRITIEGRDEDCILDDRDGLWATVDPLDGSLDYKRRCGSMGLPYTACITLLNKTKDATFDDVVAAGIIDLRSRDIWIASRREANGEYRTTLNGEPACTMRKEGSNNPIELLDLGSQIVIGEFYYPENREKLVCAFAGKKGSLRNPGSAAYEMALVSSGTAVAFICDRQKQHELGAAYALVKGAGGVAIDFTGAPLALLPYTFKSQTPVILAANLAIAHQVLVLLAKN